MSNGDFMKVLSEYKENGKITYQGDVVYSLLDEGVVDNYQSMLSESYSSEVLNDDLSGENGDIEVVEEGEGYGLSIEIDGVEYRYVSDEYDVYELKNRLKGKISTVGEGIEWIEENAVNYYNESEVEVSEYKVEEMNIKDKIEEWEEKLEEESIKIIPAGKNGVVITVYEGRAGELHEKNEVISEIEEFVSRIDESIEISDNWEFDKGEEDELDCWYNSFIIESASEDINENEGNFDEVIEDTEEFKEKMESKMNDVANQLDDGVLEDVIYKDFEVNNDKWVDVIFVGDNVDDSSKDEIEDYLRDKNLIELCNDAVGEVVDDYEDTFLEFGELDINKDGESVEILVEYKVVNDTDLDETRNFEKKLIEEMKGVVSEIDKIDYVGYNVSENLNLELVFVAEEEEIERYIDEKDVIVKCSESVNCVTSEFDEDSYFEFEDMEKGEIEEGKKGLILNYKLIDTRK